MSVEVFDKGKIVRIKLPKTIVEGCSVIVEDCEITERSENCNYCSAKYACTVFIDHLPSIKIKTTPLN